jgi:adenosylcobinamide-GDP ribazoletransferase
MFKNLITAINFLTFIPLRIDMPEDYSINRSAVWFPFVGTVIGLLLVLADYLFSQWLTNPINAIFLIAFWAFLTGGLHLDGLADCYDAFLAPVSSQRRLEILKDPCLGSFGVIGLVLHILFKIAFVMSLPRSSLLMAFGKVNFAYALLFAPTLARWLVLMVALQPNARNTGMGAAFSDSLKIGIVILAGILPLFMIVLGGVQAVIATFGAFVAVGIVIVIARSKLGGVTGDVLGLSVEISENVILFMYTLRFW